MSLEQPVRGRSDGIAPGVALGLHAIAADTVVGDGRRLQRWIVAATVATDGLAIFGALLLAHHLRFGIGSARPGREMLLVAAAPILWTGVFSAFRLYASPMMTPEEEFRRLVSAVAVGMAVLVMVAYWFKADVSRVWLGLATIFVVVLEAASRAVWRRVRLWCKSTGRIALRTLIVGTNQEARELVRGLCDAGHGYVPVGYVGSRLGARPAGRGLPVLGTVATLADTIRHSRAACVFVTASAIDAEALCSVARIARQEGVELMITSRLPEVLSTRLIVRRIGSATAMSVMSPRLTRSQRLAKRAFDVVISSLLILPAMPLMAVLAVAVRADSPGPVLFRQRRVTQGGRPFTMLKFRSMLHRRSVADADSAVTPYFKIPDQRDVTRVGRVLRRWSFDELPQLINVLRGDMSLVGPRPLPVEQVAARPDLLRPRHEVKSGMTGWWQVRGRSRIPAEQAIRLDLFYIENWSLSYDLYILLATLGAVLRGRGAR